MSQKYCWQCGESYSIDEVFDIPIFNKGFTINWCLNCAIRQLEWTDYRLIVKPLKYKRFRIESIEDYGRKYQKLLEELKLSYESQFRKIKEIDDVWGELHNIAQEIENMSTKSN